MFNESLSKRENAVMGAVYSLSAGKERFLISPYDLMALLPSRLAFDEERLVKTLNALALDGYFDFVESDRKGERVFVVHMKEAGLSYRRSDAVRRRRLLFKIAVTLLCGTLSALVGILVKSLLS